MGYGLNTPNGMIVSFFSGATMMCCLGITLFFWRFWKKTSDRLFLFFAVAFGILGFERIFILLMDIPDEFRPYVYLFRLFAFLIILIAIVDKNFNKNPSAKV